MMNQQKFSTRVLIFRLSPDNTVSPNLLCVFGHPRRLIRSHGTLLKAESSSLFQKRHNQQQAPSTANDMVTS